MSETLNPVHDYIAGGIGGLSGLVIGHPLDTLKVKQQVPDHVSGLVPPSTTTRHFGLWSTLKSIHEEGWSRGHFRGLMSPLFSYAGLNAIYFGVYGNVLMRLRSENEKGTESTKKQYKDDYMNIFLAGCAGGAVQAIPGCPFELAKVVLQSQVGAKSGSIYRGPWDACIDIIRKNGILGVYRGFLVHIVRDIPSYGLYIVAYEYLNNTGERMFPLLSDSVLNFFTGGIAGIISWTSIMPLDVVKNRIQADPHRQTYHNALHCARLAYQEDGLRVFFRGLPAISVRAFLVNGFTLMVYSYILNVLQKNIIT